MKRKVCALLMFIIGSSACIPFTTHAESYLTSGDATTALAQGAGDIYRSQNELASSSAPRVRTVSTSLRDLTLPEPITAPKEERTISSFVGSYFDIQNYVATGHSAVGFIRWFKTIL